MAPPNPRPCGREVTTPTTDVCRQAFAPGKSPTVRRIATRRSPSPAAPRLAAPRPMPSPRRQPRTEQPQPRAGFGGPENPARQTRDRRAFAPQPPHRATPTTPAPQSAFAKRAYWWHFRRTCSMHVGQTATVYAFDGQSQAPKTPPFALVARRTTPNRRNPATHDRREGQPTAANVRLRSR